MGCDVCKWVLSKFEDIYYSYSEALGSRLKEAQHLFYHMMGKGIIPDNINYKMLIRVLCREKNVEGAIEIFNKSVEQDVLLAKSTLSA